MCKPKVYPPKPSTYYRRHRTITTAEGQELRALTTRYSYGNPGRRSATGPRGGKAYQEFWRWTYYANGQFFTVKNEPVADASGNVSGFAAVARPLTASIFDVHEAQTLEQGKALPVDSIDVVNGRPVSVTANGMVQDVTAMPTAEFEALFDLA